MSCSRLASRAPMDLSHDARAFTSPRLALARDPAGSDRHSRRQHAGCRPNVRPGRARSRGPAAGGASAEQGVVLQGGRYAGDRPVSRVERLLGRGWCYHSGRWRLVRVVRGGAAIMKDVGYFERVTQGLQQAAASSRGEIDAEAAVGAITRMVRDVLGDPNSAKRPGALKPGEHDIKVSGIFFGAQPAKLRDKPR